MERSATDTDTFAAQIPVLAGFNRYGLPGMVIGALMTINAGLTYFLVTEIRDSTKAMAEVAGALNSLTQTIKDQK